MTLQNITGTMSNSPKEYCESRGEATPLHLTQRELELRLSNRYGKP